MPPASSPPQICFMVMPYGQKRTNVDATNAPVVVDFDALWRLVYQPVIEQDLGYEAVRGDQEISPLILHAMIESLALADLVVADISLANANVYWEVGLRHGASERGCVLTSADWATPAFDLGQVRHVRFPLPDGGIPPEVVEPARQALRDGIVQQRVQRSVLHDILPGWPSVNDRETRTERFRRRVDALRAVSAKIESIRAAGRADQRALALQAREQYAELAATSMSIALQVIALLRDVELWNEMADFIDNLPSGIRETGVVQEHRILATSKYGDHREAIGALRELIARNGDSSERRGLLGGRYKALWTGATDSLDGERYLDQAIEEYTRGMLLDLNDYYPMSNLPRLLRRRGAPGDESLAREAAAATQLACRRAYERAPTDPWLLPTRLGAAFDAGDIGEAQQLAAAVRRAGVPRFNLATTITDLELSREGQRDPIVCAALNDIVDRLRTLV